MKLSQFSVLSLFIAGNAVAAGPHWEYEGHHGPGHWGEMSKDFESCGLGKHQSPIDIRKAQAKTDLPELAFDYSASPLKIINNGHTIQVSIGEGGSVKIGDHVYKLIQFHFHTPSEEMVKGKPYAMVAHLVHKDADDKLAVVALLIKQGKENAALQPVFANMPMGAGPLHSVEGLSINVSDLLPAKHGYYHFEGSLTTPPCSEGVSWYVLSTPVEASAAQIKAFRKLYKHNVRPVQPLNGRTVEERAG